jgi:hypothetical protein
VDGSVKEEENQMLPKARELNLDFLAAQTGHPSENAVADFRRSCAQGQLKEQPWQKNRRLPVPRAKAKSTK